MGRKNCGEGVRARASVGVRVSIGLGFGLGHAFCASIRITSGTTLTPYFGYYPYPLLRALPLPLTLTCDDVRNSLAAFPTSTSLRATPDLATVRVRVKGSG